LVTEYGVAVNPLREDLILKLSNSELNIMTIQELRDIAKGLVGQESTSNRDGKLIGYVEYRDGSIIDKLYSI